MKLRIPPFTVEITRQRRDAPAPVDGTQQWSLGNLSIQRRAAGPGAGALPPRVPLPQLALDVRDTPGAPFLGQLLTDQGLDPNVLMTPFVAPQQVQPTTVQPTTVQPTPIQIGRWPTMGADTVDKQIRVAFRALKGGQPTSAFVPMAQAFVGVLPQLNDPTTRNNAMQWLGAFLSLGRKASDGDPAQRAATMAQQAPVWRALVDQLPALRDDRTTQYAVLRRMLRETDGPPDPALYAPLQATGQRLAALLGTTDVRGPVLRENSHDLARVLLQRLGVAAPPTPAPKPGSVEEALASLKPMTFEEARSYRLDIDLLLTQLRRATRDDFVRPALLYSLGKHTPGLNPMFFDRIQEVSKFLNDFPSHPERMFAILARYEDHTTALVAKEQIDGAQTKHAAWFIDTTANHYNAVIGNEFSELEANLLHEARGLATPLGIQQSPAGCGVMSMSLVEECFLNYDQTDATLDDMLADRPIEGSYVPDEQPHLQVLGGRIRMEGLAADHAKHMQDKDSTGRLDELLGNNAALKRTLVNKKGKTVEQRYESPGNLTRSETGQVHSMSTSKTFMRWVERSIADLEELQSHEDGGADAWRRACIRMAPVRLPDGSVTDGMVGAPNMDGAYFQRLDDMDAVRKQLDALHFEGPEGRPRVRLTREHFRGRELEPPDE